MVSLYPTEVPTSLTHIPHSKFPEILYTYLCSSLAGTLEASLGLERLPRLNNVDY